MDIKTLEELIVETKEKLKNERPSFYLFRAWLANFIAGQTIVFVTVVFLSILSLMDLQQINEYKLLFYKLLIIVPQSVIFILSFDSDIIPDFFGSKIWLNVQDYQNLEKKLNKLEKSLKTLQDAEMISKSSILFND